MVKLNKSQLIAELKKLGVEVDPAKKLTNPKLEKMLAKAKTEASNDQGEEPPERLKPEDSEENETPPSIDKEKDYLQKYQYKKQTPFGSKATNPAPGSKKDRMKQKLLKQPKVRIIIPRFSKEPRHIKFSVNLNGYRLDLPKQAYIEVPEQVAKVIMKSQKQTDEALEFRRLDGDTASEADKTALNL